MNKLNKQYFNTRKVHNKSVHPKSWIIWIAILTIGLIWIFNDISNQKNNPITEESVAKQLENLAFASQDTTIKSNNNDFRILIKKGLYYGFLSNDLPLMITSNDSTGLMLYVKKSKTDKVYDSLIEKWKSKIIKTDSTYKFSKIQDISALDQRKEIGIVELAKNGNNSLVIS